MAFSRVFSQSASLPDIELLGPSRFTTRRSLKGSASSQRYAAQAPMPTLEPEALPTGGLPQFKRRIADLLPSDRIITDPLRRLALGTDASFYRLTPALVLLVEAEDEVQAICQLAYETGTPVTFRAAGTSLSGQAVTDSVLVKLGSDGWKHHEILEEGRLIRLGPGLTGAQANAKLKPLGRKIGPDPASINSAMIGGIAANNASGMCCGVSHNTYKTVDSLRVILADGTLLDTSDKESRTAFTLSHAALLDDLQALGEAARTDEALRERIAKKFKIKNTTGYSLNALIDFTDPFDILEHILIGSEGTLAFIAEITYRTVEDPACKASALVMFETVREACTAVTKLEQSPVAAVELMDRASLRAAEGKPTSPDFSHLPDTAASLLIETRADEPGKLEEQIAAVTQALDGVATLEPIRFSRDAKECAGFWAIRKATLPSVGAMRATGTTVIIEDVAVEVNLLADAVTDIQNLFEKHGYDDGIIFGHALAGNVHFVFSQGFDDPKEVERYGAFMEDVAELIAGKYDGSLKAEHSTGRNMAPFVEKEWGAEATALMHQLKAVFDPRGILNPGVILNADPAAHLKNLKPIPPADPLVDACMECGFCEATCPTKDYTLTPRQRIVAYREYSRLQGAKGAGALKKEFKPLFEDQAVASCAADSLCSLVCPVGIDTGKAMRSLRAKKRSGFDKLIGRLVAWNFGSVSTLTRLTFYLASLPAFVFGDKGLARFSRGFRDFTGKRAPVWLEAMPTMAPKPARKIQDETAPRVVYATSCGSRLMGPQRSDVDADALPDVIERVLMTAGFHVVAPKKQEAQCCGQPWTSKGLDHTADAKRDSFAARLKAASGEGQYPIVMDTSPCTLRLREALEADGIKVLDITEALRDLVMPRVEINEKAPSVALHITCSVRKMGLADDLTALAKQLAEEVVIPEDISCCGFAGDKGFTEPELNASALRTLKTSLPDHVTEGISTSRTCEIGLSSHSGRPYRSIAVLVDRLAEPLGTAAKRKAEADLRARDAGDQSPTKQGTNQPQEEGNS